jgi:hypothetical protein
MSDIPDAASTDQLLQRIRDLRKEGGLPPVSATLPRLPFSGESAGILDLTVVIEQLVLNAGGVNMLQMMHVVSFLLDAVIDGIRQEMAPYIEHQAKDIVAQGVVSRASADLSLLNASQELLQHVLAPLTNKIGFDRTRDLAAKGYRDIPLLRLVLVSDSILEALGIDSSEYNAYFEKRFGPEIS